uniref:Uncharacterized protein n=1 Tax=Pleurozia purpurea TaxID=280637 RepID=D0R027_9MARC|nr:hypothetical protein PlpuMp28 [Pleurozia purpurea]ACR19364.1 hypothetical protein PlpuMp28 [Pleurozia purpurea]
MHLSPWSSATHLQSRFLLCSDHPYVYAQWRFAPLLISSLRFIVPTLVSARILPDSRGALSDSILVLWCPTKQSPGPFFYRLIRFDIARFDIDPDSRSRPCYVHGGRSHLG